MARRAHLVRAGPGLLPGVVKGLDALDQGLLGLEGPVAGLDDDPAKLLPENHRFDVGGAHHLALPAGGALVEIVDEIVDFGPAHGLVPEDAPEHVPQRAAEAFPLHHLGQKALLGLGDFQKVDDLAPGDEGLPGVLVVNRAPREALAAAGAGIQLDELPHVERVQGNVPQPWAGRVIIGHDGNLCCKDGRAGYTRCSFVTPVTDSMK